MPKKKAGQRLFENKPRAVRTVQFMLRLTPDEALWLKDEAYGWGMSRQELVRLALWHQQRKTAS